MSSEKVRTTLNIEKDLMKAIKLATIEEGKKLKQKSLTKCLKKNLLIFKNLKIKSESHYLW